MPKDRVTLERQMARRGWTWQQVREAIETGRVVATINRETNSPATRYIHPTTDRSVVVDDTSGEVIHVGEDAFRY